MRKALLIFAVLMMTASSTWAMGSKFNITNIPSYLDGYLCPIYGDCQNISVNGIVEISADDMAECLVEYKKYLLTDAYWENYEDPDDPFTSYADFYSYLQNNEIDPDGDTRYDAPYISNNSCSLPIANITGYSTSKSARLFLVFVKGGLGCGHQYYIFDTGTLHPTKYSYNDFYPLTWDFDMNNATFVESGYLTCDAPIAFSETDTQLPTYTAGKSYDITVKRTLKNNHWNSVLFPFNMTADEISTVFGAGTEVRKINDIKNNVVDFEEATEIEGSSASEANFYIVKPTNYNPADNTFTLTGKTLLEASEDKSTYVSWFDSNRYGVMGSACCEIDKPETPAMYALSNDKFYLLTTAQSMKGFRWVIVDVNLAASESKGLTSNFDLDGEVASTIAPKVTTSDDAPMYNLAGQRVNNATKGIIIKNGKKYLAK